jgi:hypothetical protein
MIPHEAFDLSIFWMMAMALGHILAEIYDWGAHYGRAGESYYYSAPCCIFGFEREMQAACSYVYALEGCGVLLRGPRATLSTIEC